MSDQPTVTAPTEAPMDPEQMPWRAYIMLPEDVEKLTGQKVHPEVFSIEPTGNLIHVLLEEEPREWGNIILPEIVSSLTRMGIGYIIAAGHAAGTPRRMDFASTAFGVIRDHPAELLGLHVIFAAHAGVPLRVSLMDSEFKAPVLAMPSIDVQAVDLNPEPLTDRAVRRSKQ